MDQPVVFLDIDGVLNSQDDVVHAHMSDVFNSTQIKTFKRGDWVTIPKLQLLYKLLEDIDASVVMVSSWFWGNPQTQKHIDENQDMIDFLGLTDRTILVSKNTGGGLGRGREVLNIVDTLGIKNWIVVDDAGDKMYEFDTHQIDGIMGLTLQDVEILKQRIKDGKH